MIISQRLKKFCEEKEISFEQLAEVSGVRLSTIKRIVYHDFQPSLLTVSALCRALGITENEFFVEPSMNALTRNEVLLLEYFRRVPDFKKITYLQILEYVNYKPQK